MATEKKNVDHFTLCAKGGVFKIKVNGKTVGVCLDLAAENACFLLLNK